MYYEAILLTEKYLSGKIRESGNDNAYLHSLRVAEYLRNELSVNDETVLISAVLHDIVEDSDITISTIGKLFGKTVENNVRTLTWGKSIHRTGIAKTVEKIERNLSHLSSPSVIRLIKCSDKIDNLKTMDIPADNPKFECVPYWIVEVKLSMLQLARNTHPRCYSEMSDLVEKAESKYEKQVAQITSQCQKLLASRVTESVSYKFSNVQECQLNKSTN